MNRFPSSEDSQPHARAAYRHSGAGVEEREYEEPDSMTSLGVRY